MIILLILLLFFFFRLSLDVFWGRNIINLRYLLFKKYYYVNLVLVAIEAEI